MARVRLSGYSDDIVSFDGDISTERGFWEEGYIEFSNEDVVKVLYDGSFVFEEHAVKEGSLRGSYYECEGPVRLVEVWKTWPPSRLELRDVADGIVEAMSAGELHRMIRSWV